MSAPSPDARVRDHEHERASVDAAIQHLALAIECVHRAHLNPQLAERLMDITRDLYDEWEGAVVIEDELTGTDE